MFVAITKQEVLTVVFHGLTVLLKRDLIVDRGRRSALYLAGGRTSSLARRASKNHIVDYRKWDGLC